MLVGEEAKREAVVCWLTDPDSENDIALLLVLSETEEDGCPVVVKVEGRLNYPLEIPTTQMPQ